MNGKITRDQLSPGFNGELDGINTQLSQKANKITNLYYRGVAFDTSEENYHVSWTHDNVSYDESDNSFFIVYNAKPVHNIINNVTHARKKYKNGDFGDAIIIADKLASNISCKCQSSGICANGDYIALVAHINNTTSAILGTFVYRSADKGLTWDGGTEMLVGGSSLIAYSGDVSGFKRLSNGRILAWYWDTNKKSHCLYSNDNGITWLEGTIGVIDWYNITEPTFLELDNGVIIGYARENVTDGSELVEVPAWFLKSLDGGITWQTPIISTSIIDMSNNNCCFIKHEDSNLVEIIYGSRYMQKDGLGSIYQSITTQTDLENDIWGTQYRIGTGNGIPSANNGDFGYFGSATDEDGTSLIFYYNGTKTASNIYYLEGNNIIHLNDMKLGLEGANNTPEGIEMIKNLVLGSFSGSNGRIISKRLYGGSTKLYADFAVSSTGELFLTLFDKTSGTDTALGRIQIKQDGTVYTSQSISIGSSSFLNNVSGKGQLLLNNSYGQIEVTVDSSTKGRIIFRNKDTNTTLLDLVMDTSVLKPAIDKSISLGTTTNRFSSAYFTGMVGLCSDTTANRPTTGLISGVMMFDRTLNKPIWRNADNTGWVDATGTSV